MATHTVPCDKCGGKGEITEEDLSCSASLQVRHERITCYATRQHPGNPHMAILCTPCPRCFGYDEHAQDCPDPERTESQQHWYSWTGEGKTLLQVDHGVGEAWRRRYQPEAVRV